MPCQLCDSIIDVERTKEDGTPEEVLLPHTLDKMVHNIAGFTVCLDCKNKVIQFFRDLVKT